MSKTNLEPRLKQSADEMKLVMNFACVCMRFIFSRVGKLFSVLFQATVYIFNFKKL